MLFVQRNLLTLQLYFQEYYYNFQEPLKLKILSNILLKLHRQHALSKDIPDQFYFHQHSFKNEILFLNHKK